MKIQQYERASQQEENTKCVEDGMQLGDVCQTSQSQIVPRPVQIMKNGRAISQVMVATSRVVPFCRRSSIKFEAAELLDELAPKMWVSRKTMTQT